MILEVITLNLHESLKAQKAGATQLELISNFQEGGLTPSFETIKEVTQVCNIPVFVMVRPHSKSFIYSKEDMEKIIFDIKQISKTKAEGIVFGSLDQNNFINQEQLKQVIENKGHLKLTFHRAFDKITDQFDALETLSKYDVSTILTSGGEGTAILNVSKLKELITFSKQIKPNLKILIGSGVGISNIKHLYEITKNLNYHVGSSVRENNSIDGDIEISKIEEIKKEIKKFN